MDLSSLTNLHLNCHHHSSVVRVLSFTALRWLFLSILNYLSDSAITHTAESGLWFFILLSFLTLASHLLQLGCDAGGSVMFHSGLTSCQFYSHFPFFSQICTFLLSSVTDSPQALVISCLVDGSFPSSGIPAAAPRPRSPQ